MLYDNETVSPPAPPAPPGEGASPRGLHPVPQPSAIPNETATPNRDRMFIVFMQNIDCRFPVYGVPPHISPDSLSSRQFRFDAPVRTSSRPTRTSKVARYPIPPATATRSTARSMPLSSLTGAGLASCYSISGQFAITRIAVPERSNLKSQSLTTASEFKSSGQNLHIA